MNPLEAQVRKSLVHIAKRIVEKLDKQQLLSLSRIVLSEPEDDRVRAINKSFQVQHGSVEAKDSNFFGLQISRAFTITSQFLKPERIESTVSGV